MSAGGLLLEVQAQTMPLTISDEMLDAAGLTPDVARVEIACRLFAAGTLALWAGAQWAGLTRTDFEAALTARGIPLYCPTWEQIDSEVQRLQNLGL